MCFKLALLRLFCSMLERVDDLNTRDLLYRKNHRQPYIFIVLKGKVIVEFNLDIHEGDLEKKEKEDNESIKFNENNNSYNNDQKKNECIKVSSQCFQKLTSHGKLIYEYPFHIYIHNNRNS